MRNAMWHRAPGSRSGLFAVVAGISCVAICFTGDGRGPHRTRVGSHAEPTRGTKVTQKNFETPGWKGGKGREIPKGFESWSDYTRYALEGIKVNGPVGPTADQAKNKDYRPTSLVDRKRSMGVDFGPSFVGLALSLGGVNTMPMGTLRTGEDWKELAIKIAKIASTQRVKDIVVGQPLERDGSEGKIGKLVRYFVQVLADACLLMLGNEVTVYMWDERFSTTYAAMRLGNRPRFDGEAFKRWITVRQGLNWGAKALLDSEAARAILEHWLSKDERSEIINKELSERVAPSREACMRYLKYRKVRAALPPAKDLQPEEPAGPGKEAWEWYDRHPESYEVDEEEHQSATSAFNDYMAGLDGFGDKERDAEKRRGERRTARREERRVRRARRASDREAEEVLQERVDQSQKDYQGMKLPKEKWNKYR
ncbi:unnamed protein product [Durusdinium trenchii]|uniref:YqgF/RNase H-like domain-containing protein n=1 Tax=Durusdinium trenchii TaxID=1381693 RepID=A0ABP0I5J0_9DINO